MAIGRFDRHRGMVFNPLSMEELAYAPSLLRQYEDETNAKITADADSLAGLFNTGESQIDEQANEWNNSLNELASQLAKEGYNSSIADQYHNLRRTYAQSIVPMKQFVEQRNTYNQEIQKLKADSNNIFIGGSPVSYADWQKNGNKMSDYSVENRNDLFTKGKEIGGKLATALSNPDITTTPAGENLAGYLQAKYGTSRWNSPEAIANEVDNPDSPIHEILDGYLGGVSSNGNNQDVRNAFLEGVKSTGWNNSKTGLISDKEWEMEQRIELAKQRATTSNKNSSGMPIRPKSNEYVASRKKLTGASDMPASNYSDLVRISKGEGVDANIASHYVNALEKQINESKDPRITAEYNKLMSEKPKISEDIKNPIEKFKKTMSELGVTVDFPISEILESDEITDPDIDPVVIMNEVARNNHDKITDWNKVQGAIYEAEGIMRRNKLDRMDWNDKFDKFSQPLIAGLDTNYEAEVIQFEDDKQVKSIISDYIMNNPDDVLGGIISSDFSSGELKKKKFPESAREFMESGISNIYRTKGTDVDKVTFTATNGEGKRMTFTLPDESSDMYKRLGIINDDMSVYSEFLENKYNRLLRSSDSNGISLPDIVPTEAKTFEKFQGASIKKGDHGYYVEDANGKPQALKTGDKVNYSSLSELLNSLYENMGYLSRAQDFYYDMMGKASSKTQNQEYWNYQFNNGN